MAVPPPSSLADEKAALRRSLRARRRAFLSDFDDCARRALATAAAELVLPYVGSAGSVAAYVAIGDEIDPAPLIRALESAGVAIALPHVTTLEAPMRFLRWRPGHALHAGPLGLRQPDADAEEIAPALILAPLIGFDRTGARLGQGGGFYDRIFATRPNARRIGLAWSAQEVDAPLPLEPWDVRLHAVATEREWIPC